MHVYRAFTSYAMASASGAGFFKRLIFAGLACLGQISREKEGIFFIAPGRRELARGSICTCIGISIHIRFWINKMPGGEREREEGFFTKASALHNNVYTCSANESNAVREKCGFVF